MRCSFLTVILAFWSNLLAPVHCAIIFGDVHDSKTILGELSPESAAKSMNSVAFLKELVKLKNTKDVMFYTDNIARNSIGSATTIFSEEQVYDKVHPIAAPSRSFIKEAMFIKFIRPKPSNHHDLENTMSFRTTCEYTGILWFLSKTGIRFRETVRILNICNTRKSSSVECITQYKSGSNWIECSKVICTFTRPRSSGRSKVKRIEMRVATELLARIPLPGLAGKAIKNNINFAFQKAAIEFFRQKI